MSVAGRPSLEARKVASRCPEKQTTNVGGLVVLQNREATAQDGLENQWHPTLRQQQQKWGLGCEESWILASASCSGAMGHHTRATWTVTAANSHLLVSIDPNAKLVFGGGGAALAFHPDPLQHLVVGPGIQHVELQGKKEPTAMEASLAACCQFRATI